MSNQVEMIEKLYAKVKTYKIPKEPKEGVEQLSFEITPLSLEDMGALNMREDMPLPELAKNAKVMFAKSLTISEEQASKIAFRHMEGLLEAIMDANDFNEEDIKTAGIKKFIDAKKAQEKKADD